MANSSPSPNKRASLPNLGLPTRTSLSILKPLKARCPLKDLDLVPNTEEDTTTTTFSTRVKRRVSFADVNKVKEFHTAAESLTVHHTPAYDEPFITTMSSDSSGQHHLMDSKLSDGTGLDQMSLYYADAVLDLTVKSMDNSNFKAHQEIDYEAKENFTDNCLASSQNTYYEADMECTTPHAGAFCDPKSFSFANKSSMEFTSVVSGFSEGMLSKSGMELTEVIRGPLSYVVNESKQFESMEFTQQVDGGMVVCGENSFPSGAFQPNGGFNYVRNESESEITNEFSQPFPKANIFTNQALNTSEPAFLRAGAGQVNSIFGPQKIVTDLNDSNDMSFGVTGFISAPLIETTENYVKTETNASRNVSSFVEAGSQSGRIECSNADGSEMELTEANAFTNPEAVLFVADNLEAVKKSVSENLEIKPDLALSFLRNLSGVDKFTSYNVSSRQATVPQSLENQTINASNPLVNSAVDDSSISKSISMELTKAVSNIRSDSCADEMSVLKTSTIEFTAAVAYVSETSVTKNSTMEFTKTVSNNVKYGDSNLPSDVSELNTTSEDIFSNATGRNGSTVNGAENYSESNNRCSSVGQDPIELSSKATGELDTVDFNASNVITSTQESKSSENDFEGEVNHATKQNHRVSGIGPVELLSGNRCAGACETVDFNATGVATSTQEPKITENVPSAEYPIEKSAAVIDSINFDATNVATSTQKSRLSRSVPFAADGRKSMSVESFLNIGVPVGKKCGENLDLIDPEILALEMELFKGEIRSAPDFNQSLSPSVDDVGKPSYESEFAHSRDVHGSQPMEFTNVNASAGKASFEVSSQSVSGSQPMEFTNVNASTGKANFEGGSQSISGSQLMEFTNLNTSAGKTNFETSPQSASGSRSEFFNMNASTGKAIFEASSRSISSGESINFTDMHNSASKTNTAANSQSISGSQLMECTNMHTFESKTQSDASSQSVSGSQQMEFTNVGQVSEARSQNVSVNQSMEFTDAHAFSEIADYQASSQEISGCRRLESTCGDTFDSRTNVDTFENVESHSSATLEAGTAKDRKKSRRSELFIPMKKPLPREIKMSLIEESDPGDDLGSFSTGNFSHLLTEKNEDRMRCQTLLPPTHVDVYSSGITKSSNTSLKENFDCAYKIDDSQMFTKSMLEQTACEDSLISEPAKQNSDSDVPCNKTANVLLASMIKSFHLELSLKRDMNEDTQTFGGSMTAPHDMTKNSTIIKPPNCSTLSSVFEESRFMLPLENIPRSVFLTDDIDCPTIGNISGLLSQASSVEMSVKQSTNSEASSKICVEESYEHSVENKTTQERTVESQVVEDLTNEIVSEKFVDINNDEFFDNGAEDDIGSPNLCDESCPIADFTINEDLLKNITLDRSKVKKSLRKTRCLADLDNSITRRHDEDIKKVRVSNESCNITGITKLPDLTVNSAEVSPPGKSEVDDAPMDISMVSVNENQCLTDENYEVKCTQDPVQKKNEKSPEVSEVSQVAPKIVVTDHGEQPKTDAKVAEAAVDQIGKTPRSVLKKTPNVNIIKSMGSQSSARVLNSETKKVCFMDSSEPKKRGFVKKAANLYNSFVSASSATPDQGQQSTRFSDVKRALDESYSKDKNQLLKGFLETMNPIASATKAPKIDQDQSKISEENLEDISLKYISLSSEGGFEKTNYTPKGSSNTSMMGNDSYASDLSPIFKTPKTVSKSVQESTCSPKTPPSKKRKKLPFGSTPVKNASDEPMTLSELSSHSPGSVEKNSSSKLSPGGPHANEHCPELVERFKAETRLTKGEWCVLVADSTLWSFTFLDGYLQLNIHFEPSTLNAPASVKDITFFSVPVENKPGELVSRNGKAIRVIGPKILLEKYPTRRLKSICKSSSNVFDVLHMIGTDAIYVRKIMKSLSKMIAACFTPTSVLIELTSLRPNHIVEITIDISSWTSLSASSVSVNNIIGNIRLPVIRGFFDECEKNEDCLRQFYDKCAKYVYGLNFTKPPGLAE